MLEPLAEILPERVHPVLGRTLRELAAERIFGPLRMKDTHYHDDHTELVPRRATGYSPRKAGGFQIEMSNTLGMTIAMPAPTSTANGIATV